jgi:DNA-binding NarL/FixJ family response regulator
MNPLRDCVLIVDDEFLIAAGLRMQIEDMDMVVCATAASADEAVALAQLHRPRLVLMDMRLMGEKDGVDASLVIHDTVGSHVIFITGSREPSTIAHIHTDHPAGVLFKPVADHELRQMVERVLTDR